MRLKPIRWKKLLLTADAIAGILAEYADEQLSDESIRDVCCDVSSLCGVSEDVLFKSLEHLKGSALGETLQRQLAIRIAGNVSELKQGRPLKKWSYQLVHEWAALKIVDVFYRRKSKETRGMFHIIFRVMTGSAAGMEFRRGLPSSFMSQFKRDLGFGRASWDDDYLCVYGMRLRAVLIPGPELNFGKYRVPAVNYNRKIIKGRSNPCPHGFTISCSKCLFGENDCPLAVRCSTLYRGVCQNGHEGPMNPKYENLAYCENCLRKLMRKEPAVIDRFLWRSV